MNSKSIFIALPLIVLTSVVQAQGNPHLDAVSESSLQVVSKGNPHSGVWSMPGGAIQAQGNPHIGFEQLPFRVESARK